MKRIGNNLESETTKIIIKESLEQDNFMLKLNGLTKYIVKKDIEKFLSLNSISFLKVKKSPTWNYCLISFQNLSDLNLAQETLSKLEFKNNKLFTTIIKQPQRQFKIREIIDDGIPTQEKISDQVTPLWRLPYPDQLSKKQKVVEKTVKNFTDSIFKFFPKKNFNSKFDSIDFENIKLINNMVPEQRALVQLDWVRQKSIENNRLACKVDEIIPSPETNGYRTKCEFTFGRNLDDEKTCGFLLGLFKNGVTTVIEPTECKNINDTAKKVAALLKVFYFNLAICSKFLL